MELRRVRYFVAVAEELHFGRAAVRLGIAQPPLSQQIRRLEAELGVVLLERTKRRVELTDAGRILLGEGRRLLAQAQAAERATRRAHRGEIGWLGIGFVGSAVDGVLPPVLRAFRARFPDVELDLAQLTTAEQEEALRRGRIAVGLARPPVGDPDLTVEIVRREPLVVAIPTDHVLADWPRVPLRELAGEPLVLFPRASGPGLADRVHDLLRGARVEPRVVQEATEMRTIVGLVAAGFGLSLVPASAQGGEGGVAFRPLEEPDAVVELAAVWRRTDRSTVLRSFLDVARVVGEEHRWLAPIPSSAVRGRGGPGAARQ